MSMDSIGSIWMATVSMIADAIMNPAFDEHEMLREREVILEEIKRAHDSPYKTVSANLCKACFGGTPYGLPVLGFEETVRKIDHRTLREISRGTTMPGPRACSWWGTWIRKGRGHRREEARENAPREKDRVAAGSSASRKKARSRCFRSDATSRSAMSSWPCGLRRLPIPTYR